MAGLTLGCALVLLTNVHCGEYLLLHYLLTSDYPVPSSATVKEADAPGEVQTEALPPVVEETEPSGAVQEAGPAIRIDVAAPIVQPVRCLQGDLNKDGKVDGLDIQILVNCLLEQQAE
ncbi:MAG TPA: dockerin type I domain-containing protein [Phycisphaerae bacterium]|nr:dockerin type I domain-containing protein [Phycisphaerae bacterium]